jgi:hypothetical protein
MENIQEILDHIEKLSSQASAHFEAGDKLLDELTNYLKETFKLGENRGN